VDTSQMEDAAGRRAGVVLSTFTRGGKLRPS
jgi:hypothetical protein